MHRTVIGAWLLSVIAGALFTFARFTFGTKGLLVLLAAALATLVLPQRGRFAAVVGLCLGVGGVGTWTFGTLLMTCPSAGEGQTQCYATAAPLYLAVTVGMVVVAGALTPVVLRHRAR